MKLLIENLDSVGKIKSWQLDPSERPMTIGSAPGNDVLIANSALPAYLGCIEFKSGHWIFTDFRPITLNASHSPCQKIEAVPQIEFPDSKLKFKTLNSECERLFNPLTAEPSKAPQADSIACQVVTLLHGEHRVSVDVVPLGQVWSSPLLPNYKLSTQQCDQWTAVSEKEYRIYMKTFLLSRAEIAHVLRVDNTSSDTSIELKKTGLVAMGLLAGLIFISAIFGNRTDEQNTLSEHKVIQELSLPKTVKKEMAPPQANLQASQQAAQQNSPSAASAKVKTGASQRISHLIGKISKTNVNAKNVILVGNREPSASNLEGVRANAATGSTLGSSGVAVSTLGGGSGEGISKFGSISGSKAGSQGVSLLEEEGEISGGLDREVIAQYIRQNIGQILYCYERQLSASPDLFGKVAVKFTIRGDGKVEGQRIGETTLRNASVEGCVLERVGKWKFPTPEGGTKVVVTYPFFFKSTN